MTLLIYHVFRWGQYKHLLFHECIRSCPDDFSSDLTTFEKLVKMQHYNLPTRLLDITSNPLTALFFASEKRTEKERVDGKIKNKDLDGRIVVLKVPKKRIKYYDSDTVSAIANICKRGELELPEYNENDKDRSSDPVENYNLKHLGYLLHDIRAEKPYYQPCIRKDDLERVWCVKPLMKNIRLIKQDGLFLLFGIKDNKNQFPPVLEYDNDDNIIQSKAFPIPANEKEQIRKNLNYLGISEHKLFPDLEHVAKHLKDTMLK